MPIDWPIEREDDHVGVSDSRFTAQYDEMPQLKSLASVWAERIQVMEDAAYSLMVERWLDDAEGEQLDRLGAIVGEGRLDRNDTLYRQAIRARIQTNRGSGDAPTLLEYLSNATGIELDQEFSEESDLALSDGDTLELSDGDTLEVSEFLGAFRDIRLTESNPATWVIYVGTEIRQPFASQMSPLVAAGVGAYLTSTDGQLPFGTKETGEDAPQGVGGVSDYQIEFTDVLELSTSDTLELDNGDSLEILRTASPPEAPLSGPRLAENYRVSV